MSNDYRSSAASQQYKQQTKSNIHILHLVKDIPIYSGAEDETDDFVLTSNFLRLDCSNESEERDYLKLIVLRLRGQARDLYSRNNYKSWEELINDIQKTFGRSYNINDLLLQITQTRRGKNETVLKFGERLSKLLNLYKTGLIQKFGQINNAMFNQTAEFAFNSFLFGIQGTKTELQLYHAKVSSLEKALVVIKEFESHSKRLQYYGNGGYNYNTRRNNTDQYCHSNAPVVNSRKRNEFNKSANFKHCVESSTSSITSSRSSACESFSKKDVIKFSENTCNEDTDNNTVTDNYIEDVVTEDESLLQDDNIEKICDNEQSEIFESECQNDENENNKFTEIEYVSMDMENQSEYYNDSDMDIIGSTETVASSELNPYSVSHFESSHYDLFHEIVKTRSEDSSEVFGSNVNNYEHKNHHITHVDTATLHMLIDSAILTDSIDEHNNSDNNDNKSQKGNTITNNNETKEHIFKSYSDYVSDMHTECIDLLTDSIKRPIIIKSSFHKTSIAGICLIDIKTPYNYIKYGRKQENKQKTIITGNSLVTPMDDRNHAYNIEHLTTRYKYFATPCWIKVAKQFKYRKKEHIHFSY